MIRNALVVLPASIVLAIPAVAQTPIQRSAYHDYRV
ncbi:MAG: hypothetical protein K0S86_3173, partial [Geminicoccaceae bacterium]|nr:hypothetical protein [Geminicoccaceae bacterium]